MDSTELKLLMLMLQMRGQFDRNGGPMVSKGSQTEGVLVLPGRSQNQNSSGKVHQIVSRSLDGSSEEQLKNMEIANATFGEPR